MSEPVGRESLTVNTLFNLLGDLSAYWREIGVRLGLKSTTLDDIETIYDKNDRCMIEMFDSWLLDGKDCTLSAIKEMLDEMGKHAYVERIDFYFNFEHDPSDRPSDRLSQCPDTVLEE